MSSRFRRLVVAVTILGQLLLLHPASAQVNASGATTSSSVPAVTGHSAKEAMSAVVRAGLVPKFQMGPRAARPEQVHTVYDVEPPSGTRVAEGGSVRITLYAAAVSAGVAKTQANNGVVATSGNSGSIAVLSSGVQAGPELHRVVATPFVNRTTELIDPRTGKLSLQITDMTVRAGALLLQIRRTLQNPPVPPGLLGTRWRLNWESRLTHSGPEAAIEEEGGLVSFTLDETGTRYRSASGDQLVLEGGQAVRMRTDGIRETFDLTGRLIEQVDPNDNRITLHYDGHGRLSKIEGPAQVSLQLVNDESGRVVKIASSNGSTVEYQYANGSARPAAQHQAGSMPVEYLYDQAGRLAGIERPQAGLTKFEYDSKGRVTRRTWADGTNEQYAYDEATRTRTYTDPTGQVTTHTWSQDGRSSIATTPLGQRILNEYDDAGRTIAVTGPTGQTARLTYDAMGRTIAIDDPRTGTIHFEYLADSRLPIAIISPTNRQTLEYDSMGNLVRLVNDVDPTQNSTFAYFPNGQVSSIIQGNGQKTFYTYNAAGQRETVADAAGSTWRYEYDDRGNLVRETNPLNAVTVWTYDVHNRLTSATDPSGATTRYAYEQRGRFNLVTVTDARGGTTHSTYDQRGRLISVTDAAKRTTKYKYDAIGRTTHVVNPAGETWQYEYDAAGNLIAATNPLGAITKFGYDSLGKPTSVMAPDGTEQRYQYSPMGWLVKSVRAPGLATTYEYDTEGRLIAETDATDRVTQYEYTPAGRVAKVIPPSGPPISYAYDNFGNLASILGGERVIVSYEYNALGRRVKDKHAGGLEIAYRYDAVGELVGWQDNQGGRETMKYDPVGRTMTTTDASGGTTRFSFDAAGNLVEATDPLGHVTKRDYDTAGQLVAVVEPIGDRAKYEYDAAGRLNAAVHPGGGTSSFEYDALGNAIKTVDPTGKVTQSTYDNAGRLVSVTDAKGQTTKMTYGEAGRLAEKELADGTRVRFEYDEHGRVSKVDDGEYPVLYSYDEQGNVTRIEYPAIKRSLSYEYNDAGLKTRFVNSEGIAADYLYDDLERLVAIELSGKGKIAFAYDAKNRVTTMSWPNGIKGSWTYDAADRPLRLTYQDRGGKLIGVWTYKYDPAGNCVEAADNDGRTYRYQYDAAGQLIEESIDGDNIQYAYASGGNRSRVKTKGKEVEYHYDGADQIVAAGDEVFEHDANGNLIERKGRHGTTTYRYNTLDQLIEVTLPSGERVQYRYAPTGERIARADSSGTTNYVTDGANLLAELDAALKPKAIYLHGRGTDEPLAMIRNGMSSFFHADRLGSIRRLTDSKGNLTGSFDYDAFGQLNRNKDIPWSPFTFTAREFDAATELHYYRTRWYDASTGRFLSRDPVPPQIEDPQSFNPYMYAFNSPLAYVDPWGTQGHPPQPLPRGLDPSQPLNHYTNPSFSGAMSGPGTKTITPRGGGLHVTKLPPGSGARHPEGIGTPQNTSSSFNATARDYADAGNTVVPNPHPPKGAPPGSSYIIKPPPGQAEIVVPGSTKGGGPFYPPGWSRRPQAPRSGGQGGSAGGGSGGGGSGGAPSMQGFAGGAVSPSNLKGDLSDLQTIENSDNPRQAAERVAGGAAGRVLGGMAGAATGIPVLIPVSQAIGGFAGRHTGDAAEAAGNWWGSETVPPTVKGTPGGRGWINLPPVPGSPAAAEAAQQSPAGAGGKIPLPAASSNAAAGGSIQLPSGTGESGAAGGMNNLFGNGSPSSALGPPPKPDPNAKWPICPKCGKRHDPRE
jgi:RHS repeat-associated protein